MLHLPQQRNSYLIYSRKLGGKSAILTAIAVALGGRATSTGRGTGLKSFIKEGETYVTLSFPLCYNAIVQPF